MIRFAKEKDIPKLGDLLEQVDNRQQLRQLCPHARWVDYSDKWL